MVEESIEIVISKNENRFSDSEKRIADYMLNNKVHIIDSNVSEVAGNCRVSDATVVRFAKKLGYSGFAELKISLAATISLKDTLTSFASDNKNPYECILDNSIRAFERTVSDMDKEMLDRIVKKIIRARDVFIVGVGNTYPVALDLVYKFSKLGLRTFTSEVDEIQITTCKNLTRDDIVIAVSHSGESQTVINACNCAKQNGCEVVLITNYRKSPLTEIADFAVTTNVYKAAEGARTSPFSRITEHFLIDLLFSLIESELEKNL